MILILEPTSLTTHTWHKFAKFPVKKILPEEVAADSRPLATETRYKKSEYAKNQYLPTHDTVLHSLDRIAESTNMTDTESRLKYEYIDPTSRFMGICYPGRCEQKYIYDVKLNSKVYTDPYEDYMWFLESKGDYHQTTRDTNYYKQLGLIRLGNASEADRTRSMNTSRKSSLCTEIKGSQSGIEDEVCATIDRISRLRRDWRLLVSDCKSRLDLTPDQLVYQILSKKSLNSLDHHEFVKLLRGFNINAEPGQVDSAFKLIDTDKDGRIGSYDISKLLSMKQHSPSEIRYGPASPQVTQCKPLSSDFYVPFSHLMRCILCIGENIRSIRLALTQLDGNPRLSTLAELKKKLTTYTHQHFVYKEDIDFIASHLY